MTTPNMKNTTNLPLSAGTIYFLDKNLIHFTYKKGETTLEEVKELLSYLTDYVKKNGKIKLILEIPPFSELSNEAVEYIYRNKYKQKNILTLALVIESIAQRLNSKFYHSKIETNVKTEFFKDFNKALDWITQN